MKIGLTEKEVEFEGRHIGGKEFSQFSGGRVLQAEGTVIAKVLSQICLRKRKEASETEAE